MQATCETLESRRLLHAGVHGGTLLVTGTHRADEITIQPFADPTGEFVDVSVNGRQHRFDLGSIRRVLVASFRGADVITVETSLLPVIIHSGPGDDVINASFGNDTVFAGSGNDFVRAHEGNDVLLGGAGDDTLIGGTGNDLLSGGAGNDELEALDVDLGRDTLRGGSGFDVGFIDAPPLGNDTVADDVEIVNQV